MLQARLFGPLVVEVDGSPLPPLPGLRPRSLLAWLLLHPGPHPRARLAGLFWPDVLDTSARASLRSALWSVRAALDAVGAGAWLQGDRTAAGIAADLPRLVDVEEFARLAALGDRASLRAAADLAGAPLLTDLVDDWVLQARDDWRDRAIAALLGAADLAEAAGDLPAALADTRRALEADRLQETTHRELIRRLAAAGEPAQALLAYRRCAAMLAAELGLAPSGETRALADGVRAGGSPAAALTPGPAPAPAPAAPPAPAAAPARAPARGPAVIGRDGERARLLEAWQAARAGRGGVVIVEGEAGIGKSHLVADLAAAAEEAGDRVAVGAALELDGAPPFAPWSEALRDLVRAVPAPAGETSWPADLARLCPAVESAWSRAPAPAAGAPDLERARLFEAAAELLERSVADAPTLLVLEDVHWADAASLALLAYLGRRLPRLAAMVVATRRPAVGNPELDLALVALEARGVPVEQIALGAMDQAALAGVAIAAAPGLGAGDTLRAVALGDGNPLLTREAARALAAGDDPSRGVRGRVRGPLGRLHPPERLLVDLAAVAGRPLPTPLAAALLGAEAVAPAQAAGARAGLLDPDAGDGVDFVHALVRQACAAELTPARRAWCHGRLADGLAARPQRSAAEVARHLRLAGDDARARSYLAAAAAEARALGALDETADYLREAVALAAGDPAGAAEHLLALADAEAWRGRREPMEEAFGRAAELLRGLGDAGALAAAQAARGRWLRTVVCRPAESLAAYRDARETLEDGGVDAPELRALCLAGAAWAESMSGDPSLVPELIAAARAVPETADDPGLQGELELAASAALMRAGRFADSEAPAERAAVLGRRAGRADLSVAAWANVASAAACLGDFARALALTERAPDARGVGPELRSLVLAARAHALSRLGRHDEALAAAQETLDLAIAVAPDAAVGTASFDLGQLTLAAGDPAGAVPHLRAAAASAEGHFSRPLVRLLLAEALARAGDAEGAETELGQVPFEPIGPEDLPDTLVARMSGVEGLIAAGRGDHGRAVGRLEESAAGWRRRIAQAADAGDPAAGDAYAATLTDLGRPPVAGLVEPARELARVLEDLAATLRAAGDEQEAGRAVAEAARLASRPGRR